MFRYTLVLLLLPTLAHAQFISYDKNLKTAVTTYKKDNVTVDLVAVVHIGDPDYYQQLNKLFTKYDALLYELVAPQGSKPKKGEKSLTTKLVKLALDLNHQLDDIDYNKPNFVHADLSFQEMNEEMKKRGDSITTLALRVAADLIQQANSKTESTDVLNLFAIDGPVGVKRYIAKQLTDDKTPISLDQVLVKDRNKAALKVLNQQIANGKTRLAIFYGAAHMNDFHSRLTDSGWQKMNTTWLTAWKLE